MRDIAVLIFLIMCIYASFKKPWYGVLSLAIFSYLNPHEYAWGFVRQFPAFQILFFSVVLATFTTEDKQEIPKDWRIPSFILLWLYFFFTTTQAYAPFAPYAWLKFWFVTKIYIPFYFTLVLINTREKLFYLIITIACSIGIVAVKGGLFAFASGFGNRVYGPPGTQFYENNAFAIATLIIVPLLLLWLMETAHQRVKIVIRFCLPLIFASALSSWSRGALLTMGVLLLILIWQSRHKIFLIPIIVAGGMTVSGMLPQGWINRMKTIETFQEDGSAMSRIEAWQDGWNYVLDHPLTGAGFEGWMYVTMRDWHSSYVEILSEHGFIAFTIWITLILGTLVSLTRLPIVTRKVEGMRWVSNYCYMLRASLICYMVGTLFLGLSYWDLLYHLIFISVLVKKFALEELAEKSIQPVRRIRIDRNKREASFVKS